MVFSTISLKDLVRIGNQKVKRPPGWLGILPGGLNSDHVSPLGCVEYNDPGERNDWDKPNHNHDTVPIRVPVGRRRSPV
jgi:hypothetical protein